MPVAILLIIMAILFSLFRALTPFAKQYKSEVEKHLSVMLGQPVSISSMETGWYWFQPVLKLNQVAVLEGQDQVLKLSKLLVGINVFSSLFHWHIQPGILYIDDVHLTLREVNDQWQIDGLRQDQHMTILDPTVYLPILSWFSNQQKIMIRNVSALVHLKDGSLLPISKINVSVSNNNGRYRLRGQAKLAQGVPTEVLILGDIKLNPYALHKTSGHIYLSVSDFLPIQWRLFFPQNPYQLEAGKGDFEIWIDLSKGKIANLQSQLNFRRLVWVHEGENQCRFINFFGANLAWNPTKDGWTLGGDQVKLRMGGIRWPENAFLLRHRYEEEEYFAFIKTILIQPLLSASISWPDIIKPILALRPQGELNDSQIDIKHREVNYVLTRFTNLSFKGQDHLPEVRHISGALSWQPTEGRLDIDGTNTTISPRGLKPIIFTEANGAFEWKELSHGLRISMERLVLNHRDLLLSARGALDEPFSSTGGHLRMTGEFSATQAQQWLAYLPSQYIKAKLNRWLKHDIKRINKASGQFVVDGNLHNFPFDQGVGDFSIISQLNGVDLIFNKKWPMVRDINAYLRVDKRFLNVDVSDASLGKDLTVTNTNLRMYGMGLGEETLLIHGSGDIPVSKLKAYIFTSPLKKQLAKLKKLVIKGLVNFDLNLEVPLYPENDDVLARGVLRLNDNQAIFHHALKDIQFDNLTGSLAFDEHGVTASQLNARLLGDPVSMHIQSVEKPQPSTEIKIEGDTTIELLRTKFNLAILPLIQGHLNLISRILLTDDPNDLDNIEISSSLNGVGIDLPAPLGKLPNENAPLTVKIDFNPERGVRLRFDYDHRLSSDIWFVSKKDSFSLDKGELRIGGGKAMVGTQPGLQLVGSLSKLNVKEWQHALDKLPDADNASGLVNDIKGVDLHFDQLTVWDKTYLKVLIKAQKINEDQWSFVLDQADIAGNFNYQRSLNELSGNFSRLYLPKPTLFKATNNASSFKLKPRDIPNLNLTVDVFKLGNVHVGSLALKSNSTPDNWHVDDLKITAPEYQVTAKGDWKEINGKHSTTLQATAKISRLAKGLARWEINPVVDARHGTIQFNGGWAGTINDFSLNQLNGEAFIMFNNGRITDLSPETEEKLGLGKLLSILSLQTIPRRLQLDFSDLANPGYSFDVFKGNFVIQNGVMNTTNSYIDGPVAYASMKGNLDVAKQLYDIELHVSPHITASLPIVATIAGGPIAGMAAWVVSKIINQGMQQVTGYTYKVSGPWLKPVVQQVNIYKKPRQ